jgi:hypothetical protein
MECQFDGCCGEGYVFGPKMNERRILINEILYEIHGEGDQMHCTFIDQIDGRTDFCPDPPQIVLDRMNELKGA